MSSTATLARAPPLRSRWPGVGARLMFATLGLIALLFAISSAIVIAHAQQDRREIKEQALDAARSTADLMDREVTAGGSLLQGLSTSPAVKSRDLDAVHAQFADTEVPSGSWLSLWDLTGQLVNSAAPLGSPLPKLSDYPGSEAGLERVRQRGVSVSSRDRSLVKGVDVVVVTARTNGPDRQMNGFLSLSLPAAVLGRLIQGDQLPPDWQAIILDRDLRHVASGGPSGHAFGQDLPREIANLIGTRSEGQFPASAGMAAPVLISFHRSRATGFVGVALVPMIQVDKPFTEALRNLALGGIGLGAAALLLVPLVGRTVGGLAKQASELRRALLFASARHDSFWMNTPDSLFTVRVTADERFVYEGINPAHERRTGLRTMHVAGREPHEVLPADIARAVSARYAECVHLGQPLIYDETLDLPAGSRTWRTSLVPVRDPLTSTITLLFGTASDVTERRREQAERERLNSRLQAILASVSDSYCTFGPDGRMTFANRAALDWMHLQDCSHLDFDVIFPRCDLHGTAAAIMAAGRPIHMEIASTFRPGRWIEFNIYPSAEGLTAFFRDRTEEVEHRHAIARIGALVQASLDALSGHVALLDERGTLISVNAAWTRFARERGAALRPVGRGMNYIEVTRDAVDAPEAAAVAEGLSALLTGDLEVFRQHYECGGRWWQLTANRFVHEGQARVIVVHEDVTEMRLARQAMQTLSDRLVAVQEEERRRIGRELHDSTAQHLVAISLDLMRLDQANADRAASVRDSMGRSVDEALKEIRLFSYLLHPPGLYSNGLRSTLADFVVGFGDRAGLKTFFSAPPHVDNLRPELQRSLLRVAQEALLNAHKHAGAERIAVHIRVSGRSVVLRIRDDGRGMGDTPEGAQHLGVGVPGMHTRIDRFGGRLIFHGRGGGTTVLAVVPGALDAE